MDLSDNEKNNLSISEKMEMMIQKNGNNDETEMKVNKLLTFSNDTCVNKDDEGDEGDEINVPANVYIDVEMFKDYDGNENGSVFKKIDHTMTLYGKKKLKDLLSSPKTDTYLLSERQKFIKYLKKKNVSKIVNSKLMKIKNTENKIIWYWDDMDEHIKSLYQMVYFDIPFMKEINSNKNFLQILNVYKILITPITNVALPLMSIIIPFILFKVLGYDLNYKSYISMLQSNFSMVTKLMPNMSNGTKLTSILSIGMWAIAYLYSMFNSLQSSWNTKKIIDIVHTKTNELKNIVNVANEIFTSMNVYSNKSTLNILPNVKHNIEYFNDLFKSDVFTKSPYLLSNKGEILSTYYIFLENKDKLIDILEYIGIVDAYLSISKLKNTTFVEYEKCKKPKISIKKLVHPCIDNSVPNNLTIKKTKNMLITGANAAGKSTYIKSSIISILFAQTFGVCFAKSAKITPFYSINTYMQIRDSKGNESLLEAQMNRCEEYLNKIKNMKPNQFNFTVMDEIFTSTNYKEGISAAYSITKKLVSYNNTSSLIATHYTDLSKLEKDTDCKIKNYKFCTNNVDDNVDDENTNIKYDYKLKKGVSTEYIALDIMKNKNFDEDIIHEAINMSNNICMPSLK